MGYNIRTIYRWEAGETKPRKNIIDWLRQQAETNNHLHLVSTPKFRFIDLFAGIGGLRIGFEAIGGKCVFTSEWDLACRKTYQANFSCDHPVEGDITKIEEENIPEHDVLVAGFPCQPFSIAGVSKKKSLGQEHGFRCDTQGTLFFDVARIIAYHRPAVFLLENVKNLISHNKGNTFRIIRNTLEKELGYYIDWRVINAKGFVPQNRERIFIVGFRKESGFDFSKLDVPLPENGPKLKSILHPQDGSEFEEPPFTIGGKGKVNPKYTLSDHLWGYLKKYAAKHRAKGNGFGYGLFGVEDVARTLSARYYKDGSEILIKQRGKNPRRLTPRECARLMGFDGKNRPFIEIPVSDTQAYKQFGNSVVVPVVEAIATFMRPYILNIVQKNPDQSELFSSNEPEQQGLLTQYG
ncbi:DNA (cytosine-5-)-methyltransferase [Caldithrix abyssi]|nr:DNA (cytosine-5-)-methyltransferase [Caldithrix abyssi]